MKKLLIFLAGLVLVTVTVIVVAYVFRAPLLQSASPVIAERLGVEIAELKIESISVRQIVIPKLKARYFDQGRIVDVALDQLVIVIDPWNSPQNSIQSISAKSIDLTVNISNQVAATTEPGRRAIELLQSVPPAMLAIEQAALTYQYAADKVLLYQGSITRDHKQLAITGALLVPGYFHSNVAIAATTDSTFIVNITSLKEDTDHLNFAGEISIEEEWFYLSGSGEINISEVDTLLASFDMKLPVEVTNLNSRFDLSSEADLGVPIDAVMQTIAAELDFEITTQLRSQEYEFKRIELDMRAQCIVSVTSAADCIVRQPVSAQLEFESSPAWLQDYFDWRERNFMVEINPANKISLRIQFSETPQYEANGDLRIAVLAQDAPIVMDMALSEMALSGDSQLWKLDGGFDLKLDAQGVKSPLQASRVTASIQGNLQSTEKSVQMQLLRGTKLVAQNLVSSNVEINKIELTQSNNAAVQYVRSSGEFSGSDMQYALRSMLLSNETSRIEIDDSRFVINRLQYGDDRLRVEAHINTDWIKANHTNQSLAVSSFNAELQLRDDEWQIQGSVNTDRASAPVTFEGKHHLGKNNGTATVSVDNFSLARNELIKEIVATTGLPLQFKQGSMAAHINLSWENLDDFDPTAELMLSVKNVAGDYAQNQFSELSTRIQLNGSRQRYLMEPIEVNIGRVNVGVPITNINFSFDRIEKAENKLPVVKLSELSGEALEGSIYAENIEVDLNRQVNDFSIYLFNLSLQQLLALHQTEDLIASGRFNGELPIRIQSKDFSIHAGWIKADEQGGVIKYDGIEEVLVGNPNLELVADLLKDFRYNEMSAQIDLQPDGKILLATKLHGRSPNSEFDKQVNLNFNIEFNLWKFLESARLLTRIDQDISEQIISKQRNK